MYKIFRQNDSYDRSFKEVVIDSAADLESLGDTFAPGSTAYCPETGKTYVKAPTTGWKEVPFGSIGGISYYIPGDGIKIAPDGTISVDVPHVYLERLGTYLYSAAFNDIVDYEDIGSISAFGCSTFIKDGKMYRNLDWSYNDTITFMIRCNGFYGTAFLDAITNENMNMKLINQLPYHICDGRNDHGIMVSTHVLYNDWNWSSDGETPITMLPYIILSTINSLDDFDEKMTMVLNDLSVPTSLEEQEYLLQFLVSDGTDTYVIAPPEEETGQYQVINVNENPKLSNFRWVPDETTSRGYLQERPTGVERWNLMPDCELSDLRFTLAYESPDRLSEFIGINGTTKDSTDAALRTIYLSAKSVYESRERDGSTWHTMHSVVYSQSGIEAFFVQEDFEKNYAAGPVGPQGPQGLQGPQGETGLTGDTGATFTPSVSDSGVLSWTNDGGLPNPDPVVVRGEGIPSGGTDGQMLVRATAQTSGTAWADVPTVDAAMSAVSTNAIANKAVKRYIDDHDSAQRKRIANLEAAAKGVLFTVDEDDDAAWSKDVPAGVMPYAEVMNVGGKTIVWNQLAHAPQTLSRDGITLTNNSDGSYTANGTATGHAYFYFYQESNDGNFANGHKYLASYGAASSTHVIFRLQYVNSDNITVIANGDSILTVSNLSHGSLMYLVIDSGEIVSNLKFTPQLFDLTAMFGQGSEPSTVEEFRAMFPAEYYAYAAPQLLSADVTEVESRDGEDAVIGSLPISSDVRAMCPLYGASAGSVCNEIDFGRKKYVQRVAAVDLGTLTWSKITTTRENYRFYATLSTAKRVVSGIPNIMCSLYKTDTADNTWTHVSDKLISINSVIQTPQVLIVDDSYTDATSFKTAMSGVMLYYELAEPVEIDLSSVLPDDAFIEVEAGGTLVMKNSHGSDYSIPVPNKEQFLISVEDALGGE